MRGKAKIVNGKEQRGFAVMSKERVLEIATNGGKAVHKKGKAYKWNSETARIAGKKGGGTNSEVRMIAKYGRETWARMQEEKLL
jgi:general stress protein YciG